MPSSKFLDEYLVGLGVNVKTDGLQSFFSKIDQGRQKLDLFSRLADNRITNTVSNFIGVAAKAADTALKFTGNVADFDKNIELQARKMWMTKDSYMALSEAVQTLGYSLDDIGEIALDPELSSQFRQLLNMSQGFQDDYAGMAESLRTMREFEFQFKKLNLIGKYFLNMFGAGLVKYFEGPLGQVNSDLSDIIKKLETNMPKYVNIAVSKVGPFISNLINKGRELVGLAKKIYEYFEKNPDALKRALKVATAIYTILNPIQGIAMFLFSKIAEYLEDMNDDTVDMEKKWGGIEKLVKSISGFIETAYDWILKIIDKLNSWGVFDKAVSVIDWLSNLLGGRFGNLVSTKSKEEWTWSDKLGYYINSATAKLADKISGVPSLKEKEQKVSIDEKMLASTDFKKLLEQIGYTSSDFMKSDYYKQIIDQAYDNRVNNTSNAIQITNNYNGVEGTDARRLSDAFVEQLNVALNNLSY